MTRNTNEMVGSDLMAHLMGESPVPRHSGAYIHAGARGQSAGKEFEDRVEKMFKDNFITYVDQPKYTDPFTRLSRKCDFLIIDNDGNKVFIECKQFSDLGSHMQKIPEHLQTAVSGGYGKNFCILYDKYTLRTAHQLQKWAGMKMRWEPYLREAEKNGVRINILHLDNFMEVMFPNGLTHTLDV